MEPQKSGPHAPISAHATGHWRRAARWHRTHPDLSPADITLL
ncbi:ATP-dependent DNA ligase [Streptomyces sp. NPDC057798]